MSAPLRGLALLDAAIAQIEAHPETWDQSTYRCRTGMCVAGWAADLAGGTWLTDAADDWHGDSLLAEDEDGGEHVYLVGDEKVTDADWRATRLIGLTRCEADDLFDGDNTLSDIRRHRDKIAGRIG